MFYFTVPACGLPGLVAHGQHAMDHATAMHGRVEAYTQSHIIGGRQTSQVLGVVQPGEVCTVSVGGGCLHAPQYLRCISPVGNAFQLPV